MQVQSFTQIRGSRGCRKGKWRERRDSNPRPPACELPLFACSGSLPGNVIAGCRNGRARMPRVLLGWCIESEWRHHNEAMAPVALEKLEYELSAIFPL